MKELATPNRVNHTDTLMPPGDCIQQYGNVSAAVRSIGEHALGSSESTCFPWSKQSLPASRMILRTTG